MKKTLTLRLTRCAMIAALYVALTYISAAFSLSSGVIQFRLSEMLCILPIFMPEAVFGITVGCLLANALTGCVLWDVVFGAVATLIGAIGARLLRRLPEKIKFVATLPTVLSNAVIVPFVLMYAYGAPGSYFYFMLTVSIGEITCASILGTAIYYPLKKINFLK